MLLFITINDKNIQRGGHDYIYKYFQEEVALKHAWQTKWTRCILETFYPHFFIIAGTILPGLSSCKAPDLEMKRGEKKEKNARSN